MKKTFLLVISVLLSFNIWAQSLVPPSQTEFVFADKAAADALLATEDSFTSSLSEFDRSARLRTSREVSHEEFMEFISSQGLDWTDEKKALVSESIQMIRQSLESYDISLPQQVYLVVTTGLEEGTSAYCRGSNVIAVCEFMLDCSLQECYELYLHELFHIFSRNNPEVKDCLYNQLGFKKTKNLSFPVSVEPYKITNPDAVNNDYYFEAEVMGFSGRLMPILLASQDYDEQIGGEFFDYMGLYFAFVRESNVSCAIRKSNGQYMIVSPNYVPQYFELVGQNTDYIIHPEEVLADNFVLMVTGAQDLKSPQIIDSMKEILIKTAR